MRTFILVPFIASAAGYRGSVHNAATDAVFGAETSPDAALLAEEAAAEDAEVEDPARSDRRWRYADQAAAALMEEVAATEEEGEVEDQALAEEEAEAYEEAATDAEAEQEADASDEVVAAEEVTVDLEELQPIQPPKQYRLTKLETFSDFNEFQWPTVAPDLTPSANESLIFNVKEHAQFGRGSEYSWEIAGQNRRPFRSPVLLGRLKSSAVSNSFTFKSEGGHDDIFRLKKLKNFNPFSHETTKFFLTSNDGKDVYYTIEKTFRKKSQQSHHYGGGGYQAPGYQAGGHQGGGYQGGGYQAGGYQGGGYQGGGYQGGGYQGGGYHHRQSKNQEYLYVYLGKCIKNCTHPVYEGSGHKKGLHFTFFRPGIPGPVCRVDREYVRYGPLGRKDEFVMTIEANTDGALMMAAVSIMDHLNNLEGD